MSPDASAGQGRYKTFGWQGITLTVPAAWELCRTGGDARSGYCQLSDEESVRLEARWHPARRGATPAALVDAFLRRLAPRGTRPAVERDLKLASPPGWDVESFGWSRLRHDPPFSGLGMMALCRDCRRIVQLRLTDRPGEGVRGIARTVFNSLSDLTYDGRTLWRFHDVELLAPAGMRLWHHSLQSGCTRLVFTGGRSRAEFARVSLAEVLLRGTSLEGWFRAFYAGRLRRRRVATSAASHRGHDAVEAAGRPWLLANPAALAGRPRRLRAVCWHCWPSNRLFVCSLEGPAREVDAAWHEVAGALNCCGGGRDDGPVRR